MVKLSSDTTQASCMLRHAEAQKQHGSFASGTFACEMNLRSFPDQRTRKNIYIYISPSDSISMTPFVLAVSCCFFCWRGSFGDGGCFHYVPSCPEKQGMQGGWVHHSKYNQYNSKNIPVSCIQLIQPIPFVVPVVPSFKAFSGLTPLVWFQRWRGASMSMLRSRVLLNPG